MIERIVSLQYRCLNLFMGFHRPTYLSERVILNFYVNSYDTRGSDMKLYLPTLRKASYWNGFTPLPLY